MSGQIVFKTPDIPKPILVLLNQIFEIEKKTTLHGDPSNVVRNVNRMKDAMEALGYFYEDPLGQQFQETRTDVEATISGTTLEGLTVVEVIKPIIRVGQRDLSKVIQKGIVVVEGKKKEGED